MTQQMLVMPALEGGMCWDSVGGSLCLFHRLRGPSDGSSSTEESRGRAGNPSWACRRASSTSQLCC